MDETLRVEEGEDPFCLIEEILIGGSLLQVESVVYFIQQLQGLVDLHMMEGYLPNIHKCLLSQLTFNEHILGEYLNLLGAEQIED